MNTQNFTQKSAELGNQCAVGQILPQASSKKRAPCQALSDTDQILRYTHMYICAPPVLHFSSFYAACCGKLSGLYTLWAPKHAINIASLGMPSIESKGGQQVQEQGTTKYIEKVNPIPFLIAAGLIYLTSGKPPANTPRRNWE